MCKISLFIYKKTLLVLCILLCGSIYAQTPLPQDNPLVNEVFAICNKVESEGLIASNIQENNDISLPIGIAKEIAGTQYVIAIDSARFLPAKGVCSAFMAIDLPGTMDRIAFAAKTITINPLMNIN